MLQLSFGASDQSNTHTHTLTWKCCLQSRMDVHKGHNCTSCSGAFQCDVMWVMHMEPTCKKQIAATVHVSKCQAIDLSCTRKVYLHSEDITKWHHVQPAR